MFNERPVSLSKNRRSSRLETFSSRPSTLKSSSKISNALPQNLNQNTNVDYQRSKSTRTRSKVLKDLPQNSGITEQIHSQVNQHSRKYERLTVPTPMPMPEPVHYNDAHYEQNPQSTKLELEPELGDNPSQSYSPFKHNSSQTQTFYKPEYPAIRFGIPILGFLPLSYFSHSEVESSPFLSSSFYEALLANL